MSKMKIAGLFLFLIQITVFAADAEQLLKNVRDKFSSVNDFTASIKQDGSNSVFNGTVTYKKDNMFRLELKNMTIISDGSTLWNYNKKENKVVIDAVDEDSFPFSLETLLNDYPSKSNLTSSSEGNLDILELTPKQGSGLKFKRARLWINSENLVEKIQIENPDNNYVFRLTSYKLNQDLSDSHFSFKAPEGSKVIDLR